MAFSVNKVILIGRLGKDPEVRFTGKGTAVANFSVATDESYKDSSGEKQKKTEWHNIVVWGPSVENYVQPYLYKGDLVYIEGKLQTRSWEDKEGQKRYTTEINVTDIKAQPSNSNNSDNSSSPRQSTRGSSNKPQARPGQQGAQAVADEDIPF